MAYKIILADDHDLIRDCIRIILSQAPDLQIIGEAKDGLQLLELLRHGTKPDLIISDISMPNLDGIEATRRVKTLYPDIRVLIASVHKDRSYFELALAAGADGYIRKEDAGNQLLDAIETIRHGGVFVSPVFSSKFKTNGTSSSGCR